MAVVAISGEYERMVSLSNTPTSLSDYFTVEELAKVDSVHISNRSGADMAYWYAKNAPTLTQSTGHVIPAGGERIIRGVLNARNLQLISTSTSTTCAITIGTGGVPR